MDCEYDDSVRVLGTNLFVILIKIGQSVNFLLGLIPSGLFSKMLRDYWVSPKLVGLSQQ